jgi:protein SCO1/2
MDGWAHHSALGAPTYAAAPELKLKSPGQYLFARRCAACHTIGHGVRIGPDLLGVTNVREPDWLTRFIQKPDEVLAAKDPIAMYLFKKYKQVQMPNTRLGPDDVQKIIDYLKLETRELQKPVKAAAASAQGQGTQIPASDN